MKKNQTVQGTLSKFFGKKNANSNTTSLYATNPPWIFTQEARDEGARDLDGIYYGDNRFDTVSESGTATLKARPRVRPLLTFLPLNAQENHGLAVPTPSVPEDFADKEVTGTSSLVNGNLRLYSSVGDLRPGHYGQDPSPKSSSPAPKPKPNPPSPEDTTTSSEPVDWRDPSQMAKLRSELAAYLFGSKREDRGASHSPGPRVASQGKEGKKGPSLPEKEAPLSLPEKEMPPGGPEKSPCPEREVAASLTLPAVDYIPQDAPTPSVQQIRTELEARLSSSAEKEAKPGIRSLPPKPRLEGRKLFENRADNGQSSKPVTKNLPSTSLQSKATPGPATPPKATPGPATPPKATPGPATPPKAMPGPGIPAITSAQPTTSSHLTAEKNLVPSEKWKKPKPQQHAKPSQTEAKERPSETSKPLTPGALTSISAPPMIPPGKEEVTFLYKPHHSQNSPNREVAVVIPTMARGEAAGSGQPVEVKEAQELPAKPPASAQPADELLRHPVTGEVVERGSPMALLLAARQRAQKGRSGGAGLGRSSLPGSFHGQSGQPQAGSDSIFLKEGRPNSFTVVPKLPTEAEKNLQLASSSPWKPQRGRDPEGTEPSRRGHNWTKEEPQAPVAWERSASSNLPQDRMPPKSFSYPSSPSYKKEEEEKEFSFEVIPPPPEFSNDPEPPAPALQYLGRRVSPSRNKFSDFGQLLDASPAASAAPRGFSLSPAGARYAGTGGLERFSRGGSSLIKKRLYVGDPHRNPGLSRGGSGRSLSSPNCFGPQPGGPFGAPGDPEMRRVNSAGRAPPGGLRTRRMSLENPARGEAKYKAPGGDHGFTPATSRSPHSTPLYGSPINTFTVRPGTRHPISYAYSGAHRNALS
ncbi:PREDICTED: uncharacterized protein C6orf132 homolog [Hipposideros armiger]|uniref:Uncharacterized protein C6orf132 homolog n=1 Tax=Hipposideros armiger TaxID=186990 RepID=A0A8B7RBU0_HIPAR|nr:PREDICTED: uncharacterized protein C6orf132 homolog [Hipposideros armiger]